MRNLLLVCLSLSGLAGCGGGLNDGRAIVENEAMACVNRSDIINDDGAALARICGENSTTRAMAPAMAVSPNEYDRNGAMYRAGNDAMIAMAIGN